MNLSIPSKYRSKNFLLLAAFGVAGIIAAIMVIFLSNEPIPLLPQSHLGPPAQSTPRQEQPVVMPANTPPDVTAGHLATIESLRWDEEEWAIRARIAEHRNKANETKGNMMVNSDEQGKTPYPSLPPLATNKPLLPSFPIPFNQVGKKNSQTSIFPSSNRPGGITLIGTDYVSGRAVFEINGSIQTMSIGEEVEGWFLAKVEAHTASITKNSQTIKLALISGSALKSEPKKTSDTVAISAEPHPVEHVSE